MIKNPGWRCVPSLYIAEGLPYVLVMTLSIIALKKWGIANERIAFWTSMLSLPWIVKPFFSPLIENYFSLKKWICHCQSLMCLMLLVLVFVFQNPASFYRVMAVLLIVAFMSALHDIAVDGYYIEHLSDSQQAYFAGIRNTFYKLAVVFGQGLLVVMAGKLEAKGYSVSFSWQTVFGTIACLLGLLSILHLLTLQQKKISVHCPENKTRLKEIFISFFKHKQIVCIVSFLLVYRLGEAHIVRVASLFLLDGVQTGGLGLNTEDVGWIYGIFGTLCLFAGGILAGIWGSKQVDFKKTLLYFWVAINLPDLAYILMAYFQTKHMVWISLGVCVEQFGYGFGFTGYMLALLKFVAHSPYKTAHYSCATGFMALGMMVPGMWSGYLQVTLGYTVFFTFAFLCSFLVLPFIFKIDWDTV